MPRHTCEGLGLHDAYGDPAEPPMWTLVGVMTRRINADLFEITGDFTNNGSCICIVGTSPSVLYVKGQVFPLQLSK